VTPVVFALAVILAVARREVLGLAALLTVAAIVGKQSIGIGMIPRGEVGLIFANIGLALSIGGQPIVDQAVFSAVVIMVIATTMVTPPALMWSLARNRPVQ
jgi:Kef-type K+ transport system membrane component KefB